ncbi:MAG: hypothetical protein LBE21_03545 [Pseudomonadales bacterium]|nr:hypothetical protein [Pseudomonadales bacterium]
MFSVLFGAFAALLCSACSQRISKDYHFFAEEKAYSWGTLELVPSGVEYLAQDEIPPQKGPYGIFLFFNIDKSVPLDCFYAIENLSIMNVETGQRDYYLASLDDRDEIVKPAETYDVIAFSLTNINFDYTDKAITFDFYFKDSCGPQEMYHENILLRRNYMEHSYTFWDVLMGV